VVESSASRLDQSNATFIQLTNQMLAYFFSAENICDTKIKDHCFEKGISTKLKADQICRFLGLTVLPDPGERKQIQSVEETHPQLLDTETIFWTVLLKPSIVFGFVIY
jgi:hypothetical protein